MTTTPSSQRAPRDRRLVWLGLLVVATPLLLSGGYLLLASSGATRETIGPIRGLRLGLTPSQARRELATDAPGRFRGTVSEEDFALEWRPTGAPAHLRWARLEFHLGQLVALRLGVTEEATEAEGPARVESTTSALFRDRSAEGVDVTWIARGCPTHAAELDRRLRP